MTVLRAEVRVPGVLMDLIPQYLANRKKELLTLGLAIQEKDFEAVQNIGHKLKGNAGSYGFTTLTELGGNLEIAGKNKDLNAAAHFLEQYDLYLSNVSVVPE